MAVNEQIVTGRKFRKLIDETNKLWQRISFWTKASDVEFDNGMTAEIKMGAIDGITDSLASTSSRIAASAKSVATLNSTLNNCLAQQPNFIYDSAGKIIGYKTPGGADTVFPFKDTSSIERKDFSIMASNHSSMQSTSYTIQNTGMAYIALHMFGQENYDCARGVSNVGFEVLIDGTSVFSNFPWANRAAEDGDNVNIDCFINVEVTAGQVIELRYCGGYLCKTHLGGSIIIV